MKSTPALRFFLLGSSLLAAFSTAHAADRFWDGTSTNGDANGGNGTWNAANTNWDTLATAGADTTFTTGTDSAIFGGTAGTVTLGAARSAIGVTFNTGSYVISNTVANMLTIGSGGITIDSGVASSIQIGTGVANTGYVTLGDSQQWTNNSNQTFFKRDGTLTLGAHTLTFSSPGGGLIVAASTTGGTGNIIVGANTTVSMSGNNSYSGTTTINSGGILTVNNLNNYNANGGLGNKTTNLASNLVIDGGTLRSQVSDGSTDRLFTVGANGATFESTLTGVNSGRIQLTGTTAITYSGVGNRTITIGGNSDDVNGSSIARGINDVGGGNGTVALVKNGTHAWTVSGTTNAYSGGTTVNQGTLSFGATGMMGATTGTLTVGNTNSTAAGTNTVLNLATGQNTTTGSLSGAIATPTSGTNTATINIANTRTLTVNQTTDGTYAGVIAGAGGSFTLGGLSTNKLTLTGASTYTGATTVAEGTLAVNGSLTNTSGVTVEDGGTLQGSGTINSSVTVQNGGTLSAGNSIESLATGTLNLNGGSTFEYEINSDAAANIAGDLTAAAGSLNLALSAGSILTISDLGTPGGWSLTDKLTLISYTDGWNNQLFTYMGGTLSDGASFVLDGITWLFDYDDTAFGSNYQDDLLQIGSERYVTMTVTGIPEPSAVLLGSLGLLALLRRRRN